MIKAKVSTDYKDIERIFAGGAIQKEIIKVWSTEANDYVFEAWKILEIEGPLPLTFNANGEPLIDYRIYGNTEQSGTPTPENPIIPIGCGERTENLFDYQTMSVGLQGYYIDANGYETQLPDWKITDYIPCEGSNFVLSKVGGISPAICGYNAQKEFVGGQAYNTSGAGDKQDILVTFGADVKFIRFSYYIHDDVATLMLVSGSTAPDHYIPYGYKLPILSNSTVTNIYLGEVQTTRRIKKLVLTGEETWVFQSTNSYGISNLRTGLPAAYVNGDLGLSSHLTVQLTTIANTKTEGFFLSSKNILYIRINATRASSANELKSYLTAQYAAGAPVTVWYVLDEPEISVVNEPLMKIGEYADTIDSTQTNVLIPTIAGANVIDYDGGEKHFITSDGYELVDKNQNGFLLSGSTDSALIPEKMYIKYKGR